AKKDFEICDKTMRTLNIENLKDRDYNTLSGGEARKVHLARTLAQVWQEAEPKILFLDEPIANLDLKYQYEIIKLAKERTLHNTMVIAVLHDINLANLFADEIIFMKDAEIHSVKKKGEHFEKHILSDIFETNFNIINDSNTDEGYVTLSH
ncbi:MAG TPA: ATP-binding cassette domain-containing protein, partial [Ignavibacteria bacterium]|nr:ATP-binding cassette domain-containing protein [Ignavibacteria bacterium]